MLQSMGSQRVGHDSRFVGEIISRQPFRAERNVKSLTKGGHLGTFSYEITKYLARVMRYRMRVGRAREQGQWRCPHFKAQ